MNAEDKAQHPLPVQKSDSSLSSFAFDELPQWKYSFWGSCFGLSEEERKYQEFMSKENSLYVHAALVIIGTIITIINILGASLGESSSEFKIYTYQGIIVLIPAWLHFYSVFQKKYPSYRPLPIDIIYLGDALLLTFSISSAVFIYGMATAAGCDSSSIPDPLICDDHIPIGLVVGYIVMMMMFSVLIKCRHMGVVILSIVIEICFLAIVVYIVEPTQENAFTLVFVFIVQCLVGFDCDTYSRRLYLLLVESHSSMRAKIMTDNENVVMEMQSTELRFLIGNVAHDLKTPLQAFSFELELMKSQPGGMQGCKESILLLESICSFMLMTINRAIDYTKVTSGIQLKPSLETVDVDGVFNWVKMCVAHTVTSRSVSIVVEPFSAGICNCIITDKQWLMENLLCLISNAQKFTAHGAIRITYCLVNSTTECEEGRSGGDIVCSEGIQLLARESPFTTTHESDERTVDAMPRSVASESHPPMVMVEVIDDGIGISEEMQQTLFKPFKQAMRRAGGTGLGIYSLSKRVESLGGTCGVSSRLDGKNGARFWFTLPYRPDVTVSDILAFPSPRVMSRESSPFSEQVVSNLTTGMESKPTGSSVQSSADKVTTTEVLKNAAGIMLVEDSLLIQKTCARSFLREGITVDIANNGLECVEKVLQSPNQYTVLLMDVNMPLMDGLEATERIRQWERNSGGNESAGDIESNTSGMIRESKLLIIGVSANSDSQSKQEALDAGMDRFISKPLKMSVFRDCLAEFGLDLDNFKMV
jgi:signal transduction histidine kinase